MFACTDTSTIVAWLPVGAPLYIWYRQGALGIFPYSNSTKTWFFPKEEPNSSNSEDVSLPAVGNGVLVNWLRRLCPAVAARILFFGIRGLENVLSGAKILLFVR
jgi:hypothetical protein